jgi:hypothetical protein
LLFFGLLIWISSTKGNFKCFPGSPSCSWCSLGEWHCVCAEEPLNIFDSESSIAGWCQRIGSHGPLWSQVFWKANPKLSNAN